MVEEHVHAAAYRRAAAAFRAGDLVAIEGLVADDVVWHIPGNHARAGTAHGRAALLEWLAGLPGLGFWLREHDVFGNDRHVCALSYMGARRTGIEVETRVVSIFHFENGQQTERWFFPEDAAAWDLIFGAESATGGRSLR
jgi:ketosteroid isomerase-like protein